MISHGKIFHNCLDAFEKEKNDYFLINLFRAKPFPKNLINEINKTDKFIVVDEQSPSGNLSSCVFEGFSENQFFPKIISRSLPEKYVFQNGGREYLLNQFGLSKNDLLNAAKKF